MKYMKRTKEIHIPEYLDELVIKKTKGNDEIRAYKIKNFLRSEIKNKSLREFSLLSGTKYKNIQNWLGNSERDIGIPMSEVLRLSHFMGIKRKKLFKEVKIFGGTNTKKYKLPKELSLELAYLVGYIMGDGHLANPLNTISNGSKYNAEIRITTSERHHLLYLQRIFIMLFGYSPPIYKEKNFYRLVARAKVIHRFFEKVCRIPVGNKKQKTCIPPIFMTADSLKRYFISGLFDSDGCVAIRKGELRGIRIKQYNRKVLAQCQKVFEEEGIDSSGIYEEKGIRNGKRTKSYVLAIQNERGVRLFIKKFFSLKLHDKGVGLMEKKRIPKHIAVIPDGNYISVF